MCMYVCMYVCMYSYVCMYVCMCIYIYTHMIPVFGSPARPPPPACDCPHFSPMAAPTPSTVTRISSQTQPILVTVDTLQPRLRHEDRVPDRPDACDS